MASGMWMRSLLVNRQARLMQCLAVLQVLAARRRPSSARLTRGIRRAGATSSARVLTWLFLNPTHTLIIQQTTSVNFMVVPSIGSVGTGRPFLNMYERDTSGRPPFFLHPCKTGGGSGFRQNKPSSKSILYWPGIRRSSSELSTVWQELGSAGYQVTWLDVLYDRGAPPDSPSGPVAQWLAQRPRAEWWIGLSLGASVAHIAASTSPLWLRPQRLTLINPIANRKKLAKMRGLTLDQGWPLIAEQFTVHGIQEVDLVLSTLDTQVPPEQGLSLIKCFPKARLHVIELDAGHAIEEVAMQRLLVACLLSGFSELA
jgi:hypothetical protein